MQTTHTESYPVVAEIWSSFEAAMMVQARRLAEDIAKKEGKDPKELWNLVKAQTRITLADIEFPEPTLCSYPIGLSNSAIYQRCKTPCVLGFSSCYSHAGLPVVPSVPASAVQTESVDPIKDCYGNVYYLDTKGIARDKNGKAKGCVKDGVLNIYTPRSKTEDTPSINEPPLRKGEESKEGKESEKAKAKAKAKAKPAST
jgi:hypothetical protein